MYTLAFKATVTNYIYLKTKPQNNFNVKVTHNANCH